MVRMKKDTMNMNMFVSRNNLKMCSLVNQDYAFFGPNSNSP